MAQKSPSTYLNDITSGNNDYNSTNGGQFPAMSGYDMASGLGTPVASQLANGLMGIPLAVAVSGSQPYGGTPTFTASANYAGTGTLPFGVTGLNTSGLSCTTVGASTPISPTLTAGAYTLRAATSCSGATLSGANKGDYTIVYTSAANDFTVNPAPLVITASSPTMTYASSVPTITPLYTGLQNGQSATSTPPTCSTTATSSSPVSGSPYPSTCTGASDPNYAISYLPGTVTIATAQIFVAVSGTQTYGGVPSFSGTDSPPSGVTVDTSGLSCGDVDSSTSIAPGLPAGSHALVPLSCSGAILSGPSAPNYAVAYTQRAGRLHGHPGPVDDHGVERDRDLRRLGPQRRCRVLRPEERRNRDHHAAYVQYYRHEFEPSRRFSLSVNV